MTGRKPLFPVSLLLPGMPPVCALAANVNTQSSTHCLSEFISGDPGASARNRRHAADIPYGSLTDPDGTVDFPGKADFFR